MSVRRRDVFPIPSFCSKTPPNIVFAFEPTTTPRVVSGWLANLTAYVSKSGFNFQVKNLLYNKKMKFKQLSLSVKNNNRPAFD
jgi:hypothetical protein